MTVGCKMKITVQFLWVKIKSKNIPHFIYGIRYILNRIDHRHKISILIKIALKDFEKGTSTKKLVKNLKIEIPWE